MNFPLVLGFILNVLCSCSKSSIILESNGNMILGRKLFTVFENRPYAAFYRIPYAEPPIGSLRFKPPKWRKFQLQNNLNDYTQPEEDTCSTSFNEDCLQLTIYMPLSANDTVNFPVLVWINEFSNSHGPDFFIDEELLVVSVSFRTSIFGFLCTGDKFSEGNMGAKDILMALKWIRDNINIFHGNPSKVTVVGSGIGSTIVASLVLSPGSEDLFSRIIVLSGSALSPADYRPYTFETERKLYLRMNGSDHKFNRDRFHKILNEASAMELISASRDLFDSSEVRDKQRLINSFGCVAEKSNKKYFMKKLPLEIYEQKLINKNVGVMFGYTTFESLHKLTGLVNNRKLLKYLNHNFQYLLPFEGQEDKYNSKRYNRIRKRIMDFYFVNGTIGERSLRRYAKYHSDQVVYPLLRQAILQCKDSCNNVYLYRFGFKGAFNIGWKSSVPNLNWTGATSGDEICYLFRCKSVNDVYKSVETANERHVIRNIVRLMANFVKYGNPTPNEQDEVLSTLKWEPLLCGQSLTGMSLRKKLQIIKIPEEKRMKFWDQLKREFFSENAIKDEL